MTKDIVKRLRAPSNLMTDWTHIALHGEAADEIERLRAQLESLAGAIAQIERAAAGAIYSQEMIHAMALDALKSLEVKP